jgi:hypothetical protein
MKHKTKAIEDYVIAYNPTAKKVIVYNLGLDEQMDLHTHLWSSTGCVYDWWKKNETENLFTLFIYLLDLKFQYSEILKEYFKIKSFRNKIYKSVAEASLGLCP